MGSTLTLSVLLSEPLATEGGVFSTTNSAGEVVRHDLARGDGILFRSELVHNVSRITNGERKSLVIELWKQKANKKDRFS